MKKNILFLFYWLCAFSLSAQQGQFMKCDSVAVTCEATSDGDYVFALMNVNGLGAAPTGGNWATPAVTARHSVAGQGFTRKNLGQVFGICYNTQGDAFVASTSIYSIDAWGGINNVPSPAGSTANSGSIYKISNTGITEFSELPNKGQGLGNICYDRWHNLIFATNFHDGKIYRIDGATGATLGSFDPNFDGYSGPAILNTASIGQRPWGIAAWGTGAGNVILYYSRWVIDAGNQTPGKHNEIWRVSLNAIGIPTGPETLVYSIPYLSAIPSPCSYNYSNPVADIEISNGGLRMLLSERSMSGLYTSAHISRLLELTRSNTTSNLWSNLPLNKYKVGGGSCQINSAGGCDYGALPIRPGVAPGCDSSVWVMSDYIPTTNGFGLAYGVQVLSRQLGGSPATSKIIDLNNLPGTFDKTRLGDVDYRQCLECPAPVDQNCGFFRPAPVDSLCCRARLNATSASVPGVVSVGYSVSGGTIQGFTASCPINSPASYSGTTSGTVTFIGTCTNLQYIEAGLAATSANGTVTVTWTVNFANGTSCTYVSVVKDCPNPVLRCDSFVVKQCICPNSTLSYLDIKVYNFMIPNVPICSLKINKFDNLGNPQGSYWVFGSVITPAATPFNSPYSIVPAVGSLNVTTGNLANLQLHYPGVFSGSISITSYHCNGDSCNYSWKPVILPHDWSDVKVVEVAPPLKKYFVSAFRLAPDFQQVPVEKASAKYFSISILQAQTGALKPEILAVTGAQMYPEREIKSLNLPLSAAAHGRENAFFELQSPLKLGEKDSSGYVHVLFGNSAPKTIVTTLYHENGYAIAQDTIVLENQTTGINDVRDPSQADAPPVFLLGGYPNPARETYTVQLSTDGESDLTLQVYDMTGRMVTQSYEGRLNAGAHEVTLPVAALPEGTYIVKVSGIQGAVVQPIKFVKIR